MQQPIPFDYLLSDYLERGSYKPGDIIRYRERISRTPRHILTGLTYRTKTPIPGSAAQYLMRVEHTPGDRFVFPGFILLKLIDTLLVTKVGIIGKTDFIYLFFQY